MSENCPICQTVLTEKRPSPRNNSYDCPRCGRFAMSEHTEDYLPIFYDKEQGKNDEEKTAVLSHAIRKMQKVVKKKYWPPLDDDLIRTILKQSLPAPAEQKDILIRWIGDNIKVGGDYVRVKKYSILAIIGAITEAEFGFIFQHLKTKGVVKNKTVIGGGDSALMDITLSFDGWEYYEELKRDDTDSRKAFMAMEYGNKELDGIVDEYFKPAVADTGFELYRLDENPKAGLIDDRLRVEIRNSRFLISDLTHENSGAYWEAGYAEGLGKPVIYTCKKEKFDSDKPHFDTNHHLTVIWDKKEIQEAVESLKATIRATLPDEAKLSDD